METKKTELTDEPPNTTGALGIGSADIPPNDTQGGRRVGFWDRFAQPILYPAGGSLFNRCVSFYLSFRQ